jgi:hypothetical protein
MSWEPTWSLENPSLGTAQQAVGPQGCCLALRFGTELQRRERSTSGERRRLLEISGVPRSPECHYISAFMTNKRSKLSM